MKILKIGLAVLVFAGLWVGTFLLHSAGGDDKTSDIHLGATAPDKDFVIVMMSPANIDTVKDVMRFKLDFVPQGKYMNPETHYPSMPLTLNVPDTDPKKQEQQIKAGQKPKSVEVEVDIEGEISAYPHDHYQTQMYAWLTDAMGQAVPVIYRYKDKLSGMDSSGGIEEETQKLGLLTLNIEISRTLEVRLFCYFINAMIAVLALAVVGVTYLVVIGGRKVEFGQMTWIGATLFVFVSMRNSQPSVPTFGTTLDVLIFFWAEVLTATSLVLIALTWMKRKPG
ncbi:MAG: DUF4436 family protein [Spirochaetes bacterium]|nr:DUF4436 family protein [Spirochaetota bacterium]